MLLKNEGCCNLSIEICRLLLLGFFIWSLFQECWGWNFVAVTPHLDQRDQKGGLNSHCFRAPWEWVWQTFFIKSSSGERSFHFSIFTSFLSAIIAVPSVSRQATMSCSVSFQYTFLFSSVSQVRGAPSSSHKSVLSSLSDQVWLWCFGGVWFVDFITFS